MCSDGYSYGEIAEALASAVTQIRPMMVTSKPANENRARDVDSGGRQCSLRRHEQRLERGKETTSYSPGTGRSKADVHRVCMALGCSEPTDRGNLDLIILNWPRKRACQKPPNSRNGKSRLLLG